MTPGALQAAADAARAERALQRVLLSGAEGLGRTRFLTEAGALRIDASRGLLAQTVRALVGPTPTDAALLETLSRSAALESLDPDRRAIAVELMASLLGVHGADFRTRKLDEASRREGATLELARWLVDRAQRDPLIVAFDDVHLCDDEGLSFIESLVQREEPVPLVVVVSFDAARERMTAAFKARRDVWSADPRWRRLSLEPMPAAELEALLGARGATPTQASALARHANGTPGLALGLLPAVREGTPLAQLPASLDGLRLLRVRALGPQVLEATATVAALGDIVPAAALSAVDPALLQHLAPAVQAGVLDVLHEGGFEVYRFTDPRMALSVGPAVRDGGQRAVRLAAAWACELLDSLDGPALTRQSRWLVPLAVAGPERPEVTLWAEAWAALLGGRAETLRWLERALQASTGVRRLVLLRRIAELKLFLGLPEDALTVIASAGRVTVLKPQPLPDVPAGRWLASTWRSPLDAWPALSTDEALAALELVRAECLSHLVRKEETQKAFRTLEHRLRRLTGRATANLWIRWAKDLSWFFCEILGQAPEAMRACGVVRELVPAAVLAADEDAIAFVRAEEIATTSLGDFTRARALCDEHITLAESAGKLRDACLGWNARGIVHYGSGELGASRKAFERALELAHATGWLRREAITLHNLTLVLLELGELDLAFANETTYGRLSVLIGNHAGKAEAPLVLASVELSRGRLAQAEALITQARRVAESNGWDMLTAWSRALTGQLRLRRYKQTGDFLEVTRAKNDLLAAIETFEERNFAWTEELDPAEVVAHFALASKWTNQHAAGRDVIERAGRRLPRDNVVSFQQLEVARALLAGDVKQSLGWFDAAGFKRRADFWRAM